MFAAFQIVILAGTLVVTGLLKLVSSDPRALAEHAFLTRHLSLQRGVAVWYGIGSLEIGLAVALLTVRSTWVLELVFAFAAAATIYGFLALRYATEATCGCLGSTEPVSWRGPSRALFLAAAALLAIEHDARLYDLVRFDWRAALGLACEAAALAFLFNPLRSGRAAWLALRFRQPRCLTSRHTIEWALNQLRYTHIWKQFSPLLLSSTPVDHWREGCWRLVSYDSEAYTGGLATVVFAIRLPPGGGHFRAAMIADGAKEPSTTTTESWSRWRTLRHRSREAGLWPNLRMTILRKGSRAATNLTGAK